MTEPTAPLWEQPELRAAAGATLRPGGFTLTDRGAEFIGLVPGWCVLDGGSGLGATVGRLRSRFGAEALGVELSADQIALADTPSGLIQAKGERLPFQSAAFDAIFCECVFSLFDDQPGGLQEFHRTLKPDGFLVLADLCAQQGQLSSEPSCAARAMPLSAIQRMVEAQGFAVRLIEDHSHFLKELAARLIWAGVENKQPCGCDRSLGYFMMIAQKKEPAMLDDSGLKMMELAGKGYCCSQIMVLLALDEMGSENPDLVRGSAGLCNGLGDCSGPCGVLTGALLVLGIYGGKGTDMEETEDVLPLMFEELREGFSTATHQYNGTACVDILDGNCGQPDPTRCGDLLSQTYALVREILVNNGFDPAQGRDA